MGVYDNINGSLVPIAPNIRVQNSPVEQYVTEAELVEGLSTKQDVINAFGEPDEVYESKDNGYVKYTYSNNYSKYLYIKYVEKNTPMLNRLEKSFYDNDLEIFLSKSFVSI